MIKYNHFNIDEKILSKIRKEIYHSSGPGYYVFKNFINKEFLIHIVNLWTKLEKYYFHVNFDELTPPIWNNIKYGDEDFEKNTKEGNRFFNNFFWNKPIDEVTTSVSHYICILRNRIEGKYPLSELYGFEQNALTYRVIQTKFDEISVPYHSDWNKKTINGEDETWRLQCTLILSENGKDYKGDGLIFRKNNGKQILLSSNKICKPGDLIIWRYSNQHAVINIKSQKKQIGFLRIIYPPVKIRDLQSEIQAKVIKRRLLYDKSFKIESNSDNNLLNKIKSRLKYTKIGKNLLVPIYRKFKND